MNKIQERTYGKTDIRQRDDLSFQPKRTKITTTDQHLLHNLCRRKTNEIPDWS